MVTGVSFRPQVTCATPVVKQAEANDCRERLNEVKKDVQNNQISDISAMTQKMYIESQLRDAKVEPVKYVEDVKMQAWQSTPSDRLNAAKPDTVTDVIAKFHKGAQPSKVEQSNVLTSQMNMLAASNMILHGLF